MPYPSLNIAAHNPRETIAVSRADVPLFVGLVALREESLPDYLLERVEASEYAGVGTLARTPEQRQTLLDIPVAVESWDEFDALFAWDERAVEPDSSEQIPCRLGLAVRSFFAEGGVRAWIVRTGDPLPLLNQEDDLEVARKSWKSLLSWGSANKPADADVRVPLIPGAGGIGNIPSSREPASWSGAGHILGLEEATFLALPDLPDLVSGPARRILDVETLPTSREQFIDCAPTIPGVVADPRPARQRYAAPRLDLVGYAYWGQLVRDILGMMAGVGGAVHRRDAMLILAFPLPDMDDVNMPPDAQIWPLALGSKSFAEFGDKRLFDVELVGSARLQLAYPWLKTPLASSQPEASEGGEGALLGALARMALAKGTHHAVSGPIQMEVLDTLPQLPQHAVRRAEDSGAGLRRVRDWLGAVFCLFAYRKGRFELLSDSSSSASSAWQQGSVSRLMGALLRHARIVGEQTVFENNGPEVWSEVKEEMEALLMRFWNAGALAGASPNDAFEVRCDRTTMRDADIDNGRVIAEVSFWPARSIEKIDVALTLAGAGARAGGAL